MVPSCVPKLQTRDRHSPLPSSCMMPRQMSSGCLRRSPGSRKPAWRRPFVPLCRCGCDGAWRSALRRQGRRRPWSRLLRVTGHFCQGRWTNMRGTSTTTSPAATDSLWSKPLDDTVWMGLVNMWSTNQLKSTTNAACTLLLKACCSTMSGNESALQGVSSDMLGDRGDCRPNIFKPRNVRRAAWL